MQSRIYKQDDGVNRLHPPCLSALGSTTPVLQGEEISRLGWRPDTPASPQPGMPNESSR